MTGWNDLPAELRDMVVGYVDQDIKKVQTSSSNPYRSLPLVSRDWQSYFPHINFHTIYLDQDRLDGLERYLNNNKARQQHVKYIFLRVKLPEYDCSACIQPEDEDLSYQHNVLFFNTLQRLFKITSKGGWVDGTRQPRIALDIGVYSPSDGKHAFRDFRLSSDYHSGAEGEVYKRHRDQVASAHNDPCPGWQRALAGMKPLLGMKQRVLSVIGCPGHRTHGHEVTYTQPSQERPCDRKLPVAPIFNSLHFSRQSCRRVSGHLLRIITTSLPGVRELHWETWQQPNRDESIFSRECSMLLYGNLPSTIRHLSLQHHTPTVFQYTRQKDYTTYKIHRDLAIFEVFRTLGNLESVCLSNICDPEQFLYRWRTCRPTPPLPNKTKRVIFVCRLWRSIDGYYLTNLILAAGRLAFFDLPELENMEIWCGEKANRLFLRFSYTQDRQPRVTWSSNADYPHIFATAFHNLTSEVVAHFPQRRLIVSNLEVDFLDLNDVCRASNNPELILLPESRKQIRYEEEFPLPGARQTLKSARYTKL